MPDAPQTGGRPWISELDGLRALAALSVVIAHYNPAPLVPSSRSLYAFVLGVNALALANLGVVFFFTLSAFLLTYLGVREFDTFSSFDVKRFYLRRVFRIWPLYFVILGIDFLLDESPAKAWIAQHTWMFVTFLSNWSLVFNGVRGYVDYSTPPLRILWSIAIEEQFYLLFPILLFAALRSSRCLRVIALALIGAGVLFRLVFRFVPVDTLSLGPAGGMYYSTLAYSDVFLAGGAAGWLAARQMPSMGLVSGVLRRWWSGLVLLLIMVSLGMVWQGQLWYPYATSSAFLYGATGAVFAVVILWTIANRDSLTCRFLRSGLMRSLGTISYGIYMWHPISAALVARDTRPLISMARPDNEFLVRVLFVLYLALTIAGSSLTYLFVERPFLKVKDRFFDRARTGRVPRSVSSAFQFVLMGGMTGIALLFVEIGVAAYFGRLLVSAGCGILLVMFCWLYTRRRVAESAG